MKDRQLYDLALAVKAQCRQGDMDPADTANVIGRLIDAVQDLEGAAPEAGETARQSDFLNLVPGMTPADPADLADYEEGMREAIPEMLEEARHRAELARTARRLGPLTTDDAVCQQLRDALGTEQAMHKAWRKRAEEAEAGETALRAACEALVTGWKREATTKTDALSPGDIAYEEGVNETYAVCADRLAAALADAAPDGDGWRETAIRMAALAVLAASPPSPNAGAAEGLEETC